MLAESSVCHPIQEASGQPRGSLRLWVLFLGTWGVPCPAWGLGKRMEPHSFVVLLMHCGVLFMSVRDVLQHL